MDRPKQSNLDLGIRIPEPKLRHSRRPLSRKQAAIVGFLQEHGQMTLDQATDLVGRDIYHNQKKHTGQVVSNMVRKGLIERTRPGLFQLPLDSPYR